MPPKKYNTHYIVYKFINQISNGMKKFLTLIAALIVTGSMMNVQAATYTVAGSQSAFGSNWDPSDANNDMTLVDGRPLMGQCMAVKQLCA